MYLYQKKENYNISNNIIILETDIYIFINIKNNSSYKVIKIKKSLL